MVLKETEHVFAFRRCGVCGNRVFDIAARLKRPAGSLLHDLMGSLPHERVLMAQKIPEQIVAMVHPRRLFMDEGRALAQALDNLQRAIESCALEYLNLDRR